MTIQSTARTILLFGAAAALFACNKEETAVNNSADANATAPAAANTANAAAPANEVTATPAAAPVGGAPTADYMVGKWSAMDEDCSDTLEFRKDGTVTTPVGPAKWGLAGDKLSVDFGDGTKQQPSTIKVLSPDRIEITRASGGKETEKRCS